MGRALNILGSASFITRCLALGVGAVVILGSRWRAKRAESPQLELAADYTYG